MDEEERKAGLSEAMPLPDDEWIQYLMDQIDPATISPDSHPPRAIVEMTYTYLSRLFPQEPLPPCFHWCSRSFFEEENLMFYLWHRVDHAQACQEWFNYPPEPRPSLLSLITFSEPHCDPVPAMPWEWTTYWADEIKQKLRSHQWHIPDYTQTPVPTALPTDPSEGLTQWLAFAKGVFWTSQKPVFLYWAYLLSWYPGINSAIGDFLIALLLAAASGGNPTFTHWCFRVGTKTPGFALAWRHELEPLGMIWCRDDSITPAVQWPQVLTPELAQSWAFICGSYFPTCFSDEDIHALREWMRVDLMDEEGSAWPTWAPMCFHRYFAKIEELLVIPGHPGWEKWAPFVFLKRALIFQTLLFVGLAHQTAQESADAVDFHALRNLCLKSAEHANRSLILQKHKQILSHESHYPLLYAPTSPNRSPIVPLEDGPLQLH